MFVFLSAFAFIYTHEIHTMIGVGFRRRAKVYLFVISFCAFSALAYDAFGDADGCLSVWVAADPPARLGAYNAVASIVPTALRYASLCALLMMVKSISSPEKLNKEAVYMDESDLFNNYIPIR
jgi:hypothetical protein